MIRALDPATDASAVRGLQVRAADYILLESGTPPDEATLKEFFNDAPPGCDPAASLKLGLFNGPRLDAVADVGFGYPEPQDAYIGLLLLAADQRGRGLGKTLFDHIIAASRNRGATRLLVAVLEANPRGLAFWIREGFTEELRTSPRLFGSRSHVCIRMQRPIRAAKYKRGRLSPPPPETSSG